MPITQDRMLALIADCERAEDAYNSIRAHLKYLVREVTGGHMTQEQALHDIASHAERLPDLPLRTLAIEKHHFAKVAKQNEANRRYTAARRRAEGLPERAVPKPDPWTTPTNPIQLDIPGAHAKPIPLDEIERLLRQDPSAKPQVYSDNRATVDLSDMEPNIVAPLGKDESLF